MPKKKAPKERAKTLNARMSEYYRLGQWLRAERLKAGIGVRELTRILGSSSSFVYRVENGQQRVDLLEFLDLAEALNLDPAMTLKFLRQVKDR